MVSYLVSMAWLNHQGINTEEFDNEQSPLHMEGFQSSIPLFMVRECTVHLTEKTRCMMPVTNQELS